MSDEKTTTSLTRRGALSGIGVAVVATTLSASNLFAQTDAHKRKPANDGGSDDAASNSGAGSDEPGRGLTGFPGLQDPRGKHPKPPFEEQSQPWPGLASKMHPKPDHGEASYVGSGRLKGRKALITGGDSGMGRAAAIAFAREGADVAINHLPAEESDAREVIALIKSAGRIGLSIPGDLRDEDFCNHLVEEAVRGLGGLDIVVNNAGRQQAHRSILDISTEQFDWTMKTNIYAPFWIMAATMEHLKSFGGDTALGRPGQPAELASIYVQLAADDANYTTGNIYGAGGGKGQP